LKADLSNRGARAAQYLSVLRGDAHPPAREAGGEERLSTIDGGAVAVGSICRPAIAVVAISCLSNGS